MGWIVGLGNYISIWRGCGLPNWAGSKIRNTTVNNSISMVVDLIDQDLKCWKEEVIDRIFTSEEVVAIKCIPLSRLVEEDTRVWKGDNSGEYSVRSGYRSLLDRQITDNNLQQHNNFYKKLWSLDIPFKIRD